MKHLLMDCELLKTWRESCSKKTNITDFYEAMREPFMGSTTEEAKEVMSTLTFLSEEVMKVVRLWNRQEPRHKVLSQISAMKLPKVSRIAKRRWTGG